MKYGKNWHTNSYLLGSLKIYLAVFYAFIYVPFPYLFMVPVFQSFVLLATLREEGVDL